MMEFIPTIDYLLADADRVTRNNRIYPRAVVLKAASSYYITQLNSLLDKGGPGGAVEFVLREMNKVDEIKSREAV